MLISAVQKSDLVIHIYTFFFPILFHCGLFHEIRYSSLCYTVGPCCLSILNVLVCIYQPQTRSPSLSLPPWQPQVGCLCLWVWKLGFWWFQTHPIPEQHFACWTTINFSLHTWLWDGGEWVCDVRGPGAEAFSASASSPAWCPGANGLGPPVWPMFQY